MTLVHNDNMPAMGQGLIGIQRRYRELGRLRMGEKRVAQNGKTFPAKRTEWRLTSPSRELLDVAADLYGGTVGEWKDAPTEGAQFELCTGVDRLDVIVPPGQVLSQYFELWSGGGCVRRCNGVAQTTGEVCACPNDLELRAELSKSGQACKPTTRLSVILPRIPDIGVWRVESHGMNAAVEIPGTVDILRQALEGGVLIPAQLRMEQRTAKKDGETRHFVVPVLEIPTVTVAELQHGRTPELAGPAPRELPAPPDSAPPKPTRAPRAPRPVKEPPPMPPLPGGDSKPPTTVSVAKVKGLGDRIGRFPDAYKATWREERDKHSIPALDAPSRWTAQHVADAERIVGELEQDLTPPPAGSPNEAPF